MSDFTDSFYNALLSGDRIAISSIYTDTKNQLGVDEFIEQVIVESLERMGQGWEQGTIALSQVYMAGRMCEELVETVMPTGDINRKNKPRMAISVLNDYHMLGKRIVYSVLRANGYEIMDYGRQEVNGLIDKIKADDLEILYLSVLMLPSALLVKEVMEQVTQKGLRTKIFVGGAPFRFDKKLWKEVGAHGVGKTASDALTLIKQWEGR